MPADLFVPRVVMLRHAQSEWNLQGRFTGWADPPLTPEGRREAGDAARILADHDLHFDCAYTSPLARARETGEVVLHDLGESGVPLIADWRALLMALQDMSVDEVEALEVPIGTPLCTRSRPPAGRWAGAAWKRPDPATALPERPGGRTSGAACAAPRPGAG